VVPCQRKKRKRERERKKREKKWAEKSDENII
jgi:hypothetical protein